MLLPSLFLLLSVQNPGRPVACLVPRSGIEREGLPSGGTIARPKGVCVHVAYTSMVTNTVPLVFSVAESILEMTAVVQHVKWIQNHGN